VVTGTGRARTINKTDGTKPTNLTWLGEVVWDDNHSEPAVDITWDNSQNNSNNVIRKQISHPITSQSAIIYDMAGNRLTPEKGDLHEKSMSRIPAGFYCVKPAGEKTRIITIVR
jgi:hypothetical protein